VCREQTNTTISISLNNGEKREMRRVELRKETSRRIRNHETFSWEGKRVVTNQRKGSG